MTQTMKVPTASEFISLLKFETEVKNDWIHKSVNKIFEDPDYSIGEGVIPFLLMKLILVLTLLEVPEINMDVVEESGRCGGNGVCVRIRYRSDYSC